MDEFPNGGRGDDDPDDRAPEQSSFPLKPAGQVDVTHADAPLPMGKRVIPPRRPAPIVPDRRPDERDDTA
jgi:hypothetical protein